MNSRLFEKFGRLGGQTRAKKLSPHQRSEIASRAARVRWKKPSPLLKSVRLDSRNFEDPVYLEELLLDGSISDWRHLYEVISDRPFGSVAQALKQVLSSTKYYGVTPLWTEILRHVQGK